MNKEREEAIEGICAKLGKTREQAEAFLDILGSAFKRRGWIDGEPLSQAEIGSKLDTWLGQREGGSADEQ